MSLRRTLERKAGPALVVLARSPRWVPFALVLACVVGGLLLHGVASAVLLGVVLALLGLQLFFAWPALDPAGRVLRTVVLGLIVAAAVSRF